MTNLDNVLKSRDIILPTKVHLVKAMFFPVVMYGCESWTRRKAECQRIDTFELWCWRRLLRVPWTARRSNQSILKEISPEYSLEGLMLKLKLHYFVYLMWRIDSFEKNLLLGKIEGGRKRGRQRMRWLDESSTQWTWVWAKLRETERQGSLVCCSPWGRTESDMTEQLNNSNTCLKKKGMYSPRHMCTLHGPPSNTRGCEDPFERSPRTLCPWSHWNLGALALSCSSGLSSSLTTSEPSSPVTAQAR